MRWNREHIKTGMIVRSSEGQKLGKVIALGADTFEIEKGFFILKDYLVRYSDIMDVRDGEAFLRYGKDDLRPIDEDAAEDTAAATTATGAGAFATGRQEPLGVNANRRAEELAPDPRAETLSDTDTMPGHGYADTSGAMDTPSLATREPLAGADVEEPLAPRAFRETVDAEATTIPLARERLTISKHDTQRGEVHIHKSVETETEVVEVPLRRERVSVEHVKPGDGSLEIGDAAFEERDFSIPLHAEELDVGKETVIDDELRVTKIPYEEKKRVTEKLRRERAEVRADSDADLEEGSRRGWTSESDEPTRY